MYIWNISIIMILSLVTKPHYSLALLHISFRFSDYFILSFLRIFIEILNTFLYWYFHQGWPSTFYFLHHALYLPELSLTFHIFSWAAYYFYIDYTVLFHMSNYSLPAERDFAWYWLYILISAPSQQARHKRLSQNAQPAMSLLFRDCTCRMRAIFSQFT